MKRCPKCGFIDRSHWRQNRWRTNVKFIPTLEFKELQPDQAMDLERGKPFSFDDHYAYTLGGKDHQVVERVLLIDFKVGGKSTFHIPRERHKPEDPYQQKIEVTK